MSQKSAEILLELIEKHRLTKRSFCKLAGISRASLYNYLNGNDIKPFNAKKIEHHLSKNLRVFIPYEKLLQ